MAKYEEMKKNAEFSVADLRTENDLVKILDEKNTREIQRAALADNPILQEFLRLCLEEDAIDSILKDKAKEPMEAMTVYSSDGEIVLTVSKPDQEYVPTDDAVRAMVDQGLTHFLSIPKTAIEKDTEGAKFAKENLRLRDKGGWKVSIQSKDKYLKKLDIIRQALEEKAKEE